MRVVLVRTGGFAGLRQASSVDEDSLGPEERHELRRLVEGADLWSLPADLSPAAPAPDRFRYRLTAEDGDRRLEVRVSEEAAPERLRALLRWLEETGKHA